MPSHTHARLLPQPVRIEKQSKKWTDAMGQAASSCLNLPTTVPIQMHAEAQPTVAATAHHPQTSKSSDGCW
eukprot:4901106-Amphidinium_carterae.1